MGKGTRLPGFGRRPRTVPDATPPVREADLFASDPDRATARCPVDDHCAGCGATESLTVGLSMFGPGRIACATVCPNCQRRSFLHLEEVGFSGLDARITAHRRHTDAD